MAKDFRGIIIGKLAVLVAKILDECPDEAAYKVRELEIERIVAGTRFLILKFLTIPDHTVKTGQGKDVLQFIRINALLTRPWVVVPQSTISDNSVNITEAGLLGVLDDKVLKAFTGIDKKLKSSRSWLHAQNGHIKEPQGNFWRLLFGTHLGGRFKYCTVEEYLDNLKQVLFHLLIT